MKKDDVTNSFCMRGAHNYRLLLEYSFFEYNRIKIFSLYTIFRLLETVCVCVSMHVKVPNSLT